MNQAQSGVFSCEIVVNRGDSCGSMPTDRLRKIVKKFLELCHFPPKGSRAVHVENARRLSTPPPRSQNYAAEIKLRAERKAGELLKAMEKNEGAATKKTNVLARSQPVTASMVMDVPWQVAVRYRLGNCQHEWDERKQPRWGDLHFHRLLSFHSLRLCRDGE